MSNNPLSRRDGKVRVPSLVLALALLALFTSTTVYFVYTLLSTESSVLTLLVSSAELLLSLPDAQLRQIPSTGLFKNYGRAQACARTTALSVNVRLSLFPPSGSTRFPPTVNSRSRAWVTRRSCLETRSCAGVRASSGRATALSGRPVSFSCWRRLVSRLSSFIIHRSSFDVELTPSTPLSCMIPGPCVGLGLVDIKRTCIPETGRIPNLRDAGAGFLYTGLSYGIAATALSFSTNFWATALVGYRALYVAFLFLLHSTVKLIESLAFGQGVEEVREEARHRGLARASDGARPLAPPRVWRVLLCNMGMSSVTYMCPMPVG